MRTWQVERRKRTRHLVELGGLVVKAGIVDLTGDDRATILGALLWMADKLKSDQGDERCGPQWGSKPLKRIRRHAAGQFEVFQEFVVEISADAGLLFGHAMQDSRRKIADIPRFAARIGNIRARALIFASHPCQHCGDLEATGGGARRLVKVSEDRSGPPCKSQAIASKLLEHAARSPEGQPP